MHEMSYSEGVLEEYVDTAAWADQAAEPVPAHSHRGGV